MHISTYQTYKKQQEEFNRLFSRLTDQVNRHNQEIKSLIDFKDSDYLNGPIKQWNKDLIIRNRKEEQERIAALLKK